MTKNDKNFLAVAGAGVATVLVISWLESSPNCDRGCRTQLEHLRDHLLVDLAKMVLIQFGL